MRLRLVCSILLLCVVVVLAPRQALAGDDQYLHFVGNVVQLREVRDTSTNTLIRRELWLASVTPTGLKTFQFYCTPTTQGCEDTDLLTGCSTTGVGGSNDTETYSGFKCTSGYGRCREITGQADRRAGDGQIVFNLSLNLSVFGCAAK